MPHFYFSTSIDGRAGSQSDPLDLPDTRAAWMEATVACGEIMKEIDGDFSAPGELRLDVSDETRQPLFSLRVNSEVHQDRVKRDLQ
ncbi:MAG: hypothetical protein ABWY18_17340 [Tardiphaga sp.]